MKANISVFLIFLIMVVSPVSSFAMVIGCPEGRWEGNYISTDFDIDLNGVSYKEIIFQIGEKIPQRGDEIIVSYGGKESVGYITYSYGNMAYGYIIVDTIPKDILESYVIDFKSLAVITYYTNMVFYVSHQSFIKQCKIYTRIE